jgi:pantothenate kinase
MSSFWDDVGSRLLKGTYKFEELESLVIFLKEMDDKNENVIVNAISQSYLGGYEWRGYDQLLTDVQNKGISLNQLGYFLSNLHDADHGIDQVIMNAYSKDKHYWVKHKVYRSCMGTFSGGKWVESKKYKSMREA